MLRKRSHGLPCVAACIVMTLVSPDTGAARYDHPSGLGFNYPDGWHVRETENFLVLVPPGESATLESEVVLIGAEALDAATALTDPAVVGWFDEQMLALLGSASRSGDPVPVDPDNGIALTYTGHDKRLHKVRYKRLKGLGAYVAHIGATEKLEPAVLGIFISFGGTLALDPQLIGSWYNSESSMSDVDYDSTGASSYVSSSSSRQYDFGPHNDVSYQSGSSIYAQGSVSGGTTSTSAAGDNPADFGTYTANGSRITIAWQEGGTTEWDYSVFEAHDGGMALKLVNPETGKHRFYRRR